jgi:hypothetical protein
VKRNAGAAAAAAIFFPLLLQSLFFVIVALLLLLQSFFRCCCNGSYLAVQLISNSAKTDRLKAVPTGSIAGILLLRY